MNTKLHYISILSLIIIFGNSISLYSQEYLTLPAQQSQVKQYSNTHKRILKRAIIDTLDLPFFDDFSKGNVYPDASLWSDRNVYINNGYAEGPMSLGVATFDLYNEYGEIYTNASEKIFGADTLTSRPIDLTYQQSDSVYLSFYYQCGGIGDVPQEKDSLIVEFYSPDSNQWNVMRVIPGHPEQTFNPVIIPILDVQYFNPGFRFRISNYGSLAKDSDKSLKTNADHWNIDYVYLDTGRTVNDTVINDIAITSPLPSVLEEYSSVPWDHFQNNSVPINRNLPITYRNNSSRIWSVSRNLFIQDLIGDGRPYYKDTVGTQQIGPFQKMNFPP